MAIQVEHRVRIRAAASQVYAIYQQVERWHTWDPDTKRASLDGPLAAGARGKLVPTKGQAVPMVVTQAEPDRLFTVESVIPGFKMVFEHLINPLPGAAGEVEVIHRVTFSGLLSFVLGRMVAKTVDQGLPRTLANLKALAERQQ